jgi:hypothetical protein
VISAPLRLARFILGLRILHLTNTPSLPSSSNSNNITPLQSSSDTNIHQTEAFFIADVHLRSYSRLLVLGKRGGDVNSGERESLAIVSLAFVVVQFPVL